MGADSQGSEIAMDADGLRAISEEIAQDLPSQLEHTILVLYDRDPEHLQAQWHVTREDLVRARTVFPSGGRLYQAVRLLRADGRERPEVVASTRQESVEPTGQIGFCVPAGDAAYECELGLESEDGGWLLLVRSNRIALAAPLSPNHGLASNTRTRGPHAQGPTASTGLTDLGDEPVEPALAAVGPPLHPVFPNLDLDEVSAASALSSVPKITATEAVVADRDLGFLPDIPEQPPLDRQLAANAALDTQLAAMPPPLLPSTPNREMPASLQNVAYDPRAALSSAALGGAVPPRSDVAIHAELIVSGHAMPESTVDLFGHRVRVGADGRFSIHCPIDDPLQLSLAIERCPVAAQALSELE